ncbi:MAG: FG-GAP-like repeat-containing protein, partial [Prevotellaceae bacterium]|nr:FG-GAP-like repeat-containing protein [Prevotellaceae bacterium]
MKIKYFLILSFIALCFNLLLHAQQVQENWILETPESGNKAYVARESIRIKPGFRYTATADNTFTAKIDPTLLFPPTGSTYIDASGNANSTSGAVVGSVPGAFDISAAGAATYSIPVEVPPGIQGMQPNISLVYNSQSGNGIAGQGWNLSGMSAITVGNKNIFSDAAVSPIGLMEVSDLYLDGNKLVVKPGFIYGAFNAEYETENKSYVQIKQGLNPKFIVTGKDGTVMEYGQAVKPKGAIFDGVMWLLTKVTDSNGNYITYTYKTNAAETQTVLESINYGSNGTTASPLKVQFYYQTNLYPKKQYISRYYFEYDQLLDYITVTSNAGNYQLRKYDLSYATRDKINFMTSIQETGENGETFPPANFEYGIDSKALATTKVTLFGAPLFYTVKSRYYAAADISGNGYADVFEFITDEYNNMHVHSYDGKTFQNSKYAGKLIANSAIQGKDAQWFASGNLFADFNGDGKKTIIASEYQNIQGNNCMIFEDIDNNGAAVHFLKTSKEATIYAIADLNNDGRDEIISIERVTNNSNEYPGKIFYAGTISNNSEIANAPGGTSFAQFDDINVPWISGGDKPREIYVSDFNADGLKDIMVLSRNGYHIFRNNGGTKKADGIVRVSFTHFRSFTGSINGAANGDINRTGDFNGDGLLDIITRRGAEWNLYLGTGELLFPFNKYLQTNIDAKDEDTADDDERDDCIVVDFDRDGKSDIVVYNATYKESRVTWYRSTGTSFEIDTHFSPNDTEYYYKGYATVGDFDGDGREDLFSYGARLLSKEKDTNKGFIHRCFNKDYDASLLKKISTGINRNDWSNTNTVEIKYQPLTYTKTPAGKDFYKKGNTAKYPVADILAPLYAVSKTIAVAGDRVETDYSYAGGKVNLTGKGFLGFEEMTAKNDTRNIKIKTTAAYDYEKCLPEKLTVVTSTVDDKVISTVENTFENSKSGKIYSSVLKETLETNQLNTLSKKTEYLNYDVQGNLTQSRITQGGLTIEENTVYAPKGTWAWGANKPVSVTTTHKQTGETETYTRKRSFDYDEKGRITNETIDPGDDNQLTAVYSDYDVYGHPLTVTTQAKVMNAAGSYSDVSRTVKTTYTTPSGRFLRTKENTLGEITTYEWDEMRGVLKSETDHYNRKTAYEYDNFGRLKLTSYPDGNKTVNTLQWAGEIAGKPYNAKYYSYSETSGQSPVWTWYDDSNREIRTDSYGLNRKKILVNTQYNSKGKVSRIREPYFSDVYTPETWSVEYEYDEFGRPVQMKKPMGTVTTEYDKLTVTVKSPSDTAKTTINQAGWVVEKETNGKKVNFTHYASGLVKTATPEGGTGSIEMEYDLQGNRISIKDPDAGIMESRYDGFGQLSRSSQKVHTDAPEEVKITYTYLADGRLNHTETAGKKTATVRYEYDANNRVQTISQEDHKQTFTYDNLDRIIKVGEEIDSRSFEHQTSYDALGRVAREIYPTGYYTLNGYDKYGMLTSVKDYSGRLIRQAVDENAKGQITEEKRGERTAKYTYDKRGFMTYALFSNIPELTAIGYTYDSKGNLASKTLTGESNQQTARYTYDSNNRLTDWEY